jgi:hypothetical protein
MREMRRVLTPAEGFHSTYGVPSTGNPSMSCFGKAFAPFSDRMLWSLPRWAFP